MFDDSILLTAWNSQLATAAFMQHHHPVACHTFANTRVVRQVYIKVVKGSGLVNSYHSGDFSYLV